MPKSFLFALTVALLGLANLAMASDPTGTWKSTVTLNGQALDATLRLRFDSEGPTLSGSQNVASDRPAEIANASFRGNKIGFAVVHEFEGQKVTLTYAGQLNGNTISGRAKVDFGDRAQTAEWTAVRQR